MSSDQVSVSAVVLTLHEDGVLLDRQRLQKGEGGEVSDTTAWQRVRGRGPLLRGSTCDRAVSIVSVDLSFLRTVWTNYSYRVVESVGNVED